MTDPRALKFPDSIDIESIKLLVDELHESLEDTPGCSVYAELESPTDDELTIFAEQHDGDLVIGTSGMIEHIEMLAGWLRRVIAKCGTA